MTKRASKATSSLPNQELLIVGSAAPVRSHAALLTHAIASMVAAHGVKVTCLIDALAPPPAADLPYRIVRPYAAPKTLAHISSLPRLFVIGGDGDSFPALELFQQAPGPVIPADRSLFPLLLPLLEKDGDAPARFRDLLVEKFGAPGRLVGEAYARHKRLSKGLVDLFPALDILLASAPVRFAVSAPIKHDLESGGLSALSLSLQAPETLQANMPTSDSAGAQTPPRALLIGAPDDREDEVDQALDFSPGTVTLGVADRFDPDIYAKINQADIVAIVDAPSAATCPLFWHAAHSLKSLITCGQHWARDLPHEAHLTCTPSATGLFHAVTALASSDRLADLQRRALKNWLGAHNAEASAQQAAFLNAVMAATGGPMTLALPVPPRPSHPVVEPLDTGPDQAASGAVALIGAVPAALLLERWMPGIDTQHSPQFMTIEIAQALADFLDEPLLRLVDEMGFEAPMIASGEQTAPTPSKLKSWHQIQPDLLMARTAFSMGTAYIEGVQPAPSGEGVSASWTFGLEALKHNPKQTRGFDQNTGIYWKLDRLRRSLTLVFFTGYSGELCVMVPGTTPFVITDLSNTLVCPAGAASHFQINAGGIARLKMSLQPETGANPQSIETVLASQELAFHWRACKVAPATDAAHSENKLK